jgi:hypothetical protein
LGDRLESAFEIAGASHRKDRLKLNPEGPGRRLGILPLDRQQLRCSGMRAGPSLGARFE